jgi:hypothetical protein
MSEEKTGNLNPIPVESNVGESHNLAAPAQPQDETGTFVWRFFTNENLVLWIPDRSTTQNPSQDQPQPTDLLIITGVVGLFPELLGDGNQPPDLNGQVILLRLDENSDTGTATWLPADPTQPPVTRVVGQTANDGPGSGATIRAYRQCFNGERQQGSTVQAAISACSHHLLT